VASAFSRDICITSSLESLDAYHLVIRRSQLLLLMLKMRYWVELLQRCHLIIVSDCSRRLFCCFNFGVDSDLSFAVSLVYSYAV
jgi:hypothetical protein